MLNIIPEQTFQMVLHKCGHETESTRYLFFFLKYVINTNYLSIYQTYTE